MTEVLVGALGARLVVVGEDFHFGHGRKGNVALLPRWGRRADSTSSGVALAEDRGGDAGVLHPHPASCWPRATWPGPPPFSAGPTRCGAWSCTGTAGAAPARVPDRQRGRARRDCPARRRDLRRLVRAARRDRSPAPPSRSGGGRPSTSDADGPRCSRRTCSTSTATSTVSRPGCPSWPGCGARSASTTSTTWSPRWADDVDDDPGGPGLGEPRA